MNFYGIESTEDNLISCFLDDCIGRDKDIVALARVLAMIDGGKAIALDGAWGSGKTFFVKQLKMLFEAFNPTAAGKVSENREKIKQIWKNHTGNEDGLPSRLVVYYDCWENDNDDDPILSLVYSIIQETRTENNIKGRGDYLSAAVSLLDAITGSKWTDIIEQLKNKDPLDEIREKHDVQLRVKTFLNALLPNDDDRLLVIIDELDRCNPSYAVRMLERLKHYFSDSRITYVVATNMSQLRHTICKCYGERFDALRYLDRFFDLQFSLPAIDINSYREYLGAGNRTDDAYEEICLVVAKMLKMTLREANHYLTLAEAVREKRVRSQYSDGERSQCARRYFLPIMLGLRLYEISDYQRFIEGKGTDIVEKAFEGTNWKVNEIKKLYECIFRPFAYEEAQHRSVEIFGRHFYIDSNIKPMLQRAVDNLS